MDERDRERLLNYDGEDRVISSYEMEDLLRQDNRGIIQIRSGYSVIDRALEGGFQTGELIAVSGPTKSGKTLFCQSLTQKFYEQNQIPCWFSYELHVRNFIKCFPTLPLFTMPTKLKSADMKWLEERIMESLAKHHTRIVFIDHLHYLFDLARTRNPSIEIGTVIRRLKTMSIEHDLVIFLLCHTSKGSGKEATEKRLSYENIRDSSFVSQESDTVFMIQRVPQDGPSRAELRIEFHRRTGVLGTLVPLEKVGAFLVDWKQP